MPGINLQSRASSSPRKRETFVPLMLLIIVSNVVPSFVSYHFHHKLTVQLVCSNQISFYLK